MPTWHSASFETILVKPHMRTIAACAWKVNDLQRINHSSTRQQQALPPCELA
jgi:hypothetical protein